MSSSFWSLGLGTVKTRYLDSNSTKVLGFVQLSLQTYNAERLIGNKGHDVKYGVPHQNNPINKFLCIDSLICCEGICSAFAEVHLIP